MEPNKNITIAEMLDDTRVVSRLKANIDSYNLRPDPNTKDTLKFGRLRYRRSSEDELIALGIFNPESLISEFKNIMQKSSRLSKSLRDCIKSYVLSSIYKIYQEDISKAKEDGNKEESRG